MKYLSNEPFGFGANSDKYRNNWDNTFQNPSKNSRLKQNIKQKKDIKEAKEIYEELKNVKAKIALLITKYSERDFSQLMFSYYDLQESVDHFDGFVDELKRS